MFLKHIIICPRSEASRANMLDLRTSNFQGATIRTTVLRHKHSRYCLYRSPLNFLLCASSKLDWIIFNFFRLKVVKAKCKIWKKKQTKIHWIQFQLFIFDKPTFLPKPFHRRLLSIRVFSADRHYGLIVSLRGWTLLHHVINLNQ